MSILIRGQLIPLGRQPDGDSIRFRADRLASSSAVPPACWHRTEVAELESQLYSGPTTTSQSTGVKHD